MTHLNPFKYGRVVSGTDFFGREDLITQISGNIESAQNIVIHGDRRVGKTSLIHEVARRKRYKLLYVDFMNVRSEDDMCRRVLREIIAAESSTGYFIKIMAALSHLRPVMTMDRLTMSPEIKMDASIKLETSSISEMIALIDRLYGKKETLVVAFDEFQDIGKLAAANEIYALMRSKIQFQKSIPYIYAGSNRHNLHIVFNALGSPFFKSAISISVGLFPREEFMSFVMEKFKTGQRTIDKPILNVVFDTCRDIPGDVQQFCEAIWSVTKERDIISEMTIKAAIELIFARQRASYEYIMANLTDIQAKCLLAIARTGGKLIYSGAFQKESGTSTAATQRAIEKLQKQNIIYEVSGVHEFMDPFFRHWITINN